MTEANGTEDHDCYKKEPEWYFQPLLFVFLLTPEPRTSSLGYKRLVSDVWAFARSCVCVCVHESEGKSVSMLTSALQTPHFTASAPLTIAPRSLHARSLPLYFAYVGPPPLCVTKFPFNSPWFLSKHILLSFFYQSASFDLFDWFLDRLSISQRVGYSVCPSVSHPSGCLFDTCWWLPLLVFLWFCLVKRTMANIIYIYLFIFFFNWILCFGPSCFHLPEWAD